MHFHQEVWRKVVTRCRARLIVALAAGWAVPTGQRVVLPVPRIDPNHWRQMRWALAAGCRVNPMKARPAVVPRDLTLALQAVLFDPMPAVRIVLMHSPSRSAAVAALPIPPVAAVEQMLDYPILPVAAAHRRSFPTPELAVGQACPIHLAVAEEQQEYPILLRLPHRAEQAHPMRLAVAEK